MEALSIVTIVLGATGFWRLLEVVLERRKLKAEVSHLYSQVNSEIIANWVSWSKKLEERVKDLEAKNEAMSHIIDKQKDKILELEKQILQWERS